MRVLNTVWVVEHDMRLSVRSNALVVRRGRELAGRYPLAGLESVVIASAAGISAEALGRCVRAGVRVVSLHRGGAVRFSAGGPTSGNVHLRIAQLRAADSPQQSARLAQVFVAGKLQNSRRMLQRWTWAAPSSTRWLIERQVEGIEDRLRGLESARDLNRIRGMEGDAARRYFKGLAAHLADTSPETPFQGRDRRPPRDPVNALLSFAYGVWLAAAVGALESVGLDPQIGFLHGFRPGRPSLALDLLEEFRAPLADRFVTAILGRRQFGLAQLERLPGGAWHLTSDGRRRFFELFDTFRGDLVRHPLLLEPIMRSQLLVTQATLLARHLRGDLDVYPPYLMQR